jgi:quinol monooxygenase YgiN
MAVVVMTRIKAKAGLERQLELTIRAMIAKVREDGLADCPRYALYRHAKDPAFLILCEHYDSLAAPDSDSDATSEPTDALIGLIDGRPVLETFIEVEVN